MQSPSALPAIGRRASNRFLRASVVALTAATMTYRLLRRTAERDNEAEEDEGS